MKHLHKGLLAIILLSWFSSAYAQEHIRLNLTEKPVEHQEIRLPEKLLPDLPFINQSLSMQDAVTVGLKNNLGIQVSRSETDIRRALLKGALAERWPVISLGSLTFLRAGETTTPMTPDTMMNTVDKTLFQDVNASGRIPLFTGGRIRGRIRAERFSLGASIAALGNSSVDTAYQIKEAYLKTSLTEKQYSVHQFHIDLGQALLKNAEVRYKVGKALRADVLRIQTDLADARRMLNNEHAQLNDTLFDLKAAMGVDLASDVALADPLTFQPWQGGALSNLVQLGIANHPKVREAQQRIKETQAQVRMAKSEYWPQVYGQVTGNLRFPDRPLVNGLGNGAIGVVTASLPVFSRTRRAKIQQAEATFYKAEQEYKAIQLEIAKKIAKAWNELTFAKENVALADTAVKQAEENLRLIQRRYDVGLAILVQVTDAWFALRQAQLNQVQAIYNHELAKARLVQSVGEIDEKASHSIPTSNLKRSSS